MIRFNFVAQKTEILLINVEEKLWQCHKDVIDMRIYIYINSNSSMITMVVKNMRHS